ncbi:MAG: icmV [Francisellaceae bacterium]|nr:icmV [Francisellaceae bacterium]
MGFWRGAAKVAGTFVNLRVDKWIGLEQLLYTFKKTYQAGRKLLQIEQVEKEETYDEAYQRLNLSDLEINHRKKQFFNLMIFYICLFFMIFSYGVFMAVKGSFLSFLLSFSLSIFALVRAFFYHFWLFQINQKKLGCSLQEWMDYYLYNKG